MRSCTHTIEINSVCNLRCPFCLVNNGMRRPRIQMPLERVVRLLDEIASLGDAQEIYLFNYGEPLLHPDIVRIVAASTSRGIRTRISTNGTRLADVGPSLVDAGLTVLMIDLDGISAEAHSTYRVGSDVEPLKVDIATFARHAFGPSARTVVVLQTIVHKRNIGEMDAIRAFAKANGIRWIAWKNLALDLGVTLTVSAFKQAHTELIPDDPQFDRYTQLLRHEDFPCPFGEMNGVVLSTGDYVVCTHDAEGDVVLGNVFETGYLSLRETAFEAMRDHITRKALSICRTCSMSRRLGVVEDVLTGRQIEGSVNFTESGIAFGLHGSSEP